MGMSLPRPGGLPADDGLACERWTQDGSALSWLDVRDLGPDVPVALDYSLISRCGSRNDSDPLLSALRRR